MKTERIMVRLDEEMYKKFKEQAKKEMRTNSDLMRVAIHEYLNKKTK